VVGGGAASGLRTGADDYLTKPFNLEELLLRVNKLIQKNTLLQDKDNGQGWLYNLF
jgi:DNA-binding response OmpR family regulator